VISPQLAIRFFTREGGHGKRKTKESRQNKYQESRASSQAQSHYYPFTEIRSHRFG